ncbi:MAG: hypothetical protein AAFY71_24860 [Bacteroidota bacterium]
MASYIIFPLLFVLLPGLLLWLEPKVKLIGWLSVAFWCYVLGIILGNVWEIPEEILHQSTDITVALAIPILLFSADVPKWLRLARPTAISYGLYLISLSTVVVAVAKLGHDWVPYPQLSAAMTATVWTGGTPNMTAVGKMLGASEDVLIPGVTLTDLMLSGILLVIVLSVLHGFYRTFLRPFPKEISGGQEAEEAEEVRTSPGRSVRNIVISVLLGGLCVGIIAGCSMLIFGELNIIFVMIGLTLMGMLVSFVPNIRKMPLTYETGEYIFLIFCIAIGATTDIQSFLQQAGGLLSFMGAIMLGNLLLHALLARIFKIDADTVMITLVSGVFSTPFIGPVANKLDNREIVVSGLTLSAINFAIGNFFGLTIYQVLELLG